jgi:hypothetical protein
MPYPIVSNRAPLCATANSVSTPGRSNLPSIPAGSLDWLRARAGVNAHVNNATA